MPSQLRLNANEDDAKAFLATYDEEFSELQTAASRASWDYETNLTDHNANFLVSFSSTISDRHASVTLFV